MKNEYGDFQTSIALAERICTLLKSKGINPGLIIEPTCGKGNFIVSSVNTFRNVKRIVGIEIQNKYVFESRKSIGELKQNSKMPRVEIIQDDIFTHVFEKELFDDNEGILFLGNPPWVTNSELEGKNLPKKSNFKKNNGLDAITGKSNFDISEYILLHLMKTFNGANGHLAFLCKTQVAKNIIQFLPSTDFLSSDFKIYLIDAKKEFNAAVDACLFVCKLAGNKGEYQCSVFDMNYPDFEIKRFGWIGNKFVSDITKYNKNGLIDGDSPLIWRSGIKHDCSDVMELFLLDGSLKNKLNETIVIEDGLVYPFIKSSDLKKLVIKKTNRRIIITQKKPGEETSYISEKFPKTWNYLNAHKSHFKKRKSIIYLKNPHFSIFGVGDYSFKPYKIVVSGLYKKPNFALLLPMNGKPIMVDDSCYFLGFDNLRHALIILSVLNSKLVKDFLESICFSDSKRPYTKEVLMRIDFLKALNKLNYGFIDRFVSNNQLSFEEITNDDFLEMQNSL